MFRDREEALRKLEEALLEEELLEESLSEQEQELPRADSGYANFANGYRVYNTDRIDTDLEEYSQQVYEGAPKGHSGLWITLLLLFLLGLGLLGGWLLRQSGVF